MAVIEIDRLIDIVSRGGRIQTGVDVFNDKGVLLIEKEVVIDSVNPLLVIKRYGVQDVTIEQRGGGGLWDRDGKRISVSVEGEEKPQAAKRRRADEGVIQRIKRIRTLKQEAEVQYRSAKKNITKVLEQIKQSGGEFDFAAVDQTVTDLLNFLSRKGSAFSYLTREILSYDDYLYNHSVNVCTIATAVLRRFNEHFSQVVNDHLASFQLDSADGDGGRGEASFVYYLPEEIHDMAIGFFLHDIGKVLIPSEILNKKGPLTAEEFTVVRRHSFDRGPAILEKCRIQNPLIENIVRYHHAALYRSEARCYPEDKLPIEVPPYVKVCKLADIYDAMTSKRCYKEALNPIAVVTEIFRTYARKNRMLQFLLHSFVKVIGVFPPGSILYLLNGQMAFVIDSEGPIVLPITDAHGRPLQAKPDPIDLGNAERQPTHVQIDRRRPLKTPMEVQDLLPAYLKEAA